MFCNSESEAYKLLLLLTDKLSNDQLTLQKQKTRVLTAQEYRDRHKLFEPDETSDTDEQKLMRLTVRYDPYSPTAVKDYHELKTALEEIDIIGVLTREVNKTRIDKTVTRQAINAVATLDQDKQKFALRVLLDKDNLITLAPVFSSIMRAVRSIYTDLNSTSKDEVDHSILDLFASSSYLVDIDINVSYIVQVLAMRHSQEKEELFVRLFDKHLDHIIRRQIIIAMSNWDCHYWISDIKSSFTSMTTWERRSIIYSSYFLGDEGKHWRNHNKDNFSSEELLCRSWFSTKIQNNANILP